MNSFNKSLILTKAAYIRLKTVIMSNIKITVFYLNIFQNVIYSCNAKAEFSATIILQCNNIWCSRNMFWLINRFVKTYILKCIQIENSYFKWYRILRYYCCLLFFFQINAKEPFFTNIENVIVPIFCQNSFKIQ